jgi:hypothetical protein
VVDFCKCPVLCCGQSCPPKTCINGVCQSVPCPSGYSCSSTAGVCVCDKLCGTICCPTGQMCCGTTCCPDGKCVLGVCGAPVVGCGLSYPSGCASEGTGFTCCGSGLTFATCCGPGTVCCVVTDVSPNVAICCGFGTTTCGYTGSAYYCS